MSEDAAAIQFNVPETVESLEAVPEKFRSLYVEKNGTFVFQDPAVLSRSLEYAKREREEAKKKAATVTKWERLGKTPEEIEELLSANDEAERKKAQDAGDYAKILKQHQDKWDTVRTALEAELTASRSSERTAIIENSVMSALSRQGVTEEGIDLLPERLAGRINFKLQDGRRVITIMQPDGETPMIGSGKSGEATYDDLVKEAMSKWPSLFKASGQSGSGARQGSSSNTGGAVKTTKAALKSRADRAAFVDANGHEAYFALPDK